MICITSSWKSSHISLQSLQILHLYLEGEEHSKGQKILNTVAIFQSIGLNDATRI